MGLDLGKYVKLPEVEAEVGVGADVFKLVATIAVLVIIIIIVIKLIR